MRRAPQPTPFRFEHTDPDDPLFDPEDDGAYHGGFLLSPSCLFDDEESFLDD